MGVFYLRYLAGFFFFHWFFFSFSEAIVEFMSVSIRPPSPPPKKALFVVKKFCASHRMMNPTFLASLCGE